jgi:hypothetical protein
MYACVVSNRPTGPSAFHYDTVIGLTPHYLCVSVVRLLLLLLLLLLTEGPNMSNVTYNEMEVNFRLCKYKVQCDSFGTRPKKMRISQRLFIRFWTGICDYIPCFMRSMSILEEVPLHSEKTGVWCAISRRRPICPICPVFFHETLNTARYLEIFNEFVNQFDDNELRNGCF